MRDVVWPRLEPAAKQHDAFYCKRFKRTSPFPTKRIDKPLLQFVGQPWEVSTTNNDTTPLHLTVKSPKKGVKTAGLSSKHGCSKDPKRWPYG